MMRLHVVTDSLGIVAAAATGGATIIQVRLKGRTDRELYDFAREAVAICAAHATMCVVNDRVDIALAVGAQGTHVGAHDLTVEAVRRIAGPSHLVGGTAREPVQAARLVAEGADYLGVGPAFATTTKDGLPEPLGPAGIEAVAHAVSVPVIAIGGVTMARVPSLLAAGAAGVAVVGAVASAPDPAAATRALLEALS